MTKDPKLISGPVFEKPRRKWVTKYLGSFSYHGQKFDLWDSLKRGQFLHVNSGGCSTRGTTLGEYVTECKEIVHQIVFGKKRAWLALCLRVSNWRAKQ